MANKVLKTMLTLVYIIGIACVGYYSFLYLQHSTQIPHPDAMLPMMQYEIGACALMMGLPFMTASSVAMIAIHKIKKWSYRLICLLPSVLSVIFIAMYWILEA